MARPSKQPHVLPAILEALRTGATRAAACAVAGVTPRTLQRWQGDETRQNTLAQAEAEAEVYMVGVIRKAAEAGSWKAAAYWLERRRPDEWGKREHLKVDIEQRVTELATELGLDPAEVLAEAQRLLDATKRRW